MSNSIADRVSNFLKEYPPFNMLQKKLLLEIALKVNIIYMEKGDVLYKKDDPFSDFFYMVRNGSVCLYHPNADESLRLVNINDGGDVFGVRPLITKENYKLTAIANEESIVYAIPINTFEAASKNNLNVYKYLVTALASSAYDPYTAEENSRIFVDYLPDYSHDVVNFQTANYTKNPIYCPAEATLKNAAIKMSKFKIGCIIVVDDNINPVGIITNSDIKNKIATGQYPINTKVTNVMSAPVITGKKNLTLADGQLKMIKHGINHLGITEDGSPNSKLVGVLSHHDVITTLGNNPTSILKEIKRAERTKKIRAARLKANTLIQSYLNQNIPITHIIDVISQINDAVTIRAIEIALKKMPTPPPVKFSWFALGSQGRKEQLLFSDQDNALVFEDVPKKQYAKTQDYFLQLAKLVTKTLNKVGFEYCEADMMASNSNWCKSISQWKMQFKEWILKPDEKAVLLSSIFFDYSLIYGDYNLEKELTNTIYESLEKTSLFFKYLCTDAIKTPPPLGFFKQFVVEQNGEHKELFNIKKRALMPLIDAGRLLVLSKQVRGINSTYQRFEKLAELEPENKELFESCAYAFKALLKFKTKQGILNGESSKFIDLEKLTKEEKLKLKRCFKPLNGIQESLKLRFEINTFM
ncbi:DUF294 nucleotidyltransferase-like domain-containing protein [Aestuariivivens sediminis]|uniref:DUF294 nucleotidyltransferase-like domain-containing protein n=1 Tax=Aestuariivivens sediminis TaxID=2913557 RepID=UPI001F568DC8|nr:DUF294 nucleotidyltransferase-like domain-containing protein [Aestuariivivens sediminis]